MNGEPFRSLGEGGLMASEEFRWDTSQQSCEEIHFHRNLFVQVQNIFAVTTETYVRQKHVKVEDFFSHLLKPPHSTTVDPLR